jgi:hypothetical protein
MNKFSYSTDAENYHVSSATAVEGAADEGFHTVPDADTIYAGERVPVTIDDVIDVDDLIERIEDRL